MKNALLIAAALGLSVSGAYACPYAKSVKAEDTMTVASVATPMTTMPDATTTGSVQAETKVKADEKSE